MTPLDSCPTTAGARDLATEWATRHQVTPGGLAWPFWVETSLKIVPVSVPFTRPQHQPEIAAKTANSIPNLPRA